MDTNERPFAVGSFFEALGLKVATRDMQFARKDWTSGDRLSLERYKSDLERYKSPLTLPVVRL